MIFDVWKMKKLDKGVVTDMAGTEEVQPWNLQSNWDGNNKTSVTEPKAGSESRSTVTNSCSEVYQVMSSKSDASN